jgi:hypothetical protein
MGIVIEFPASASRREADDLVLDETITATVIILPVIRIERHAEPTGTGPEETAASGCRRRRRARS